MDRLGIPSRFSCTRSCRFATAESASLSNAIVSSVSGACRVSRQLKQRAASDSSATSQLHRQSRLAHARQVSPSIARGPPFTSAKVRLGGWKATCRLQVPHCTSSSLTRPSHVGFGHRSSFIGRQCIPGNPAGSRSWANQRPAPGHRRAIWRKQAYDTVEAMVGVFSDYEVGGNYDEVFEAPGRAASALPPDRRGACSRSARMTSPTGSVAPTSPSCISASRSPCTPSPPGPSASFRSTCCRASSTRASGASSTAG